MSLIDSDDWETVSSRRRRRTHEKKKLSRCTGASQNTDLIFTNEDVLNEVDSIHRIENLVITSQWFQQFLASVKKSISEIESHLSCITEIICYGIGSFSRSSNNYFIANNAKYQLAAIRCLIEVLLKESSGDDSFNIHCSFFDPVFSKLDICVLKMMGHDVIDDDERGKRNVRIKGVTIFYMPHCPEHLYSNVVCANWGTVLSKFVIIGNSFTAYVERGFSKFSEKQLNNSIFMVQSLCIEYGIGYANTMNDDQLPHLEKAFNDLACMVFPSRLLNSIEGLRILSAIPDFIYEH